MNSIKVVLTKDTIKLFESGTVINTKHGKYLFFPFWLKDNKNGTYTMYHLDDLPKHLQLEIRNIR